MEKWNESDLLREVINLARKVRERMGRKIKLMEVCGTHTMVISKSGIRALFADSIELLSGPGCPVCVTDQRDIDRVIFFARKKGLTISTFGDMIKVPGSFSSLEKERAKGANVEVFYSPLDSLKYAEKHPEREVVFIGVGFETTAPIVSHSILLAKEWGIKNFSVLSLHKTLPPAMRVLLDDPELSLDGLILPGHVCTITGRKAFDFVARDFNLPSCISGFEPEDVIEAIGMVLLQILKGAPEVQIGYRRLVKEEGNVKAQKMIEEVFEPCSVSWRGFGEIPESGLSIREEYADYDASRKFELPAIEMVERKNGCICGEIIKGKKKPPECKLFEKVCNPSEPYGPCMVSQEGACSAYYHFGV